MVAAATHLRTSIASRVPATQFPTRAVLACCYSCSLQPHAAFANSAGLREDHGTKFAHNDLRLRVAAQTYLHKPELHAALPL